MNYPRDDFPERSRRPGFFVNGRRYSLDQRAMAVGRAEFLAAEYGRPVSVVMKDHAGAESVSHIARSGGIRTELSALPALLPSQAHGR